MNKNTIGSKIAILRKSNNISQNDLAQKLNVSNKTISKWECDKSTPDISIIKKMSDIFQVSLEYFVDDDVSIVNKFSNNRISFRLLIISISIFLILSTSVLLAIFIPRTPNVESSIFNINNDSMEMQCIVDNKTSTFSLNEKFNVPFRNEWKLYSDINAQNEIVSNVVELKEGDNKFYLLIFNSNNTKKLYTVNIRRKPIYSITFVVNGNIFTTENIEEGMCLSVPDNAPTRDGYDFDKWIFDFSQPIMSNMTINSTWLARNDTRYIVSYYHANLDGGFDLVCSEEFTGTTGTYIKTEVKEYQHFNHLPQKSLENDTLRYNGQRFTHYYERKEYTVTFDCNGGSKYGEKTWSTTIKYGQFPSYVPPSRDGYNFEGWDYDLTNITSNITVKAVWSEWCTFSTTTNNPDGGQYSQYTNHKVGRTYTVTLYVKLNDGYCFDGWYNGEEYLSSDLTFYFTMPRGDILLVAKFTKIN